MICNSLSDCKKSVFDRSWSIYDHQKQKRVLENTFKIFDSAACYNSGSQFHQQTRETFLMRIKAFKALRPEPQNAERVSSPPYDVLNSGEARDMAAGNPMSFLHVIKPEIDLPEGTDIYSDEVYAKAVENFTAFRQKGYLVRDEQDCLYLYSQTMGDHTQYGLVCCCRADDYETLIKKHEFTLKPKEDDRTRHVSDLNANAGPVFLTYRDEPEIDRILNSISVSEPLFNVDAPDGTVHKVWSIPGGKEIVGAFENVPALYVADGHHRSASAVRVARERAAANLNHTGEEEYNWFQCVLFPASQLKLMAYNRVVKDLNGLSKEEFIARLQQDFELHPESDPEPKMKGAASIYIDGGWTGISWPKLANEHLVDGLDASIIQKRLLDPILGIEDPRTSARIDFVGGIRGVSALENAVDSGKFSLAISMYPVDIKDLMLVADANLVMPPKSTWFEPKLRSGLLVHALD